MAYKLGVIGAGNMGRAILRGAIQGGILSAGEIVVAEIDPERQDDMRTMGCHVVDDAAGATDADHLLLAVKPQGFPAVAEAMGQLTRETIVISIMAGLSSSSIREALGDAARVIRVMPNTPCQIGAGMTGVALGAGARPGDEAMALNLFDSLGRTAIIEDESLMHAVTAVSGSGPAYVFLLAEAMEQAAAEIGLDPTTARTLVQQTIVGAGQLMAHGEANPAVLRHAVTSPGGTTAAALAVMEEGDLVATVVRALIAARDRGVELDG